MSKIILVLMFTLSLLFCEEEELTKYPLVGIGVSTQTVDTPLKNNQETTISLRYGTQSLDWRTMITYEFQNTDYQSLSVELDKVLLDELFGTAKLRPYLGLSGGVLKYKDIALEDSDGFYYGGNGGFIIYLTDTIDLDLSYHYNVVQEIETLDSIQGATFSLHYFF